MRSDILLIEDDPAASVSIKEMLAHGHAISDAADIDSAVKMAAEKKFLLAILDIDMKGAGGLISYTKLRRVDPSLKVMMISLSNDIALAVSATKMGVVDFLRKPIEADRLKEAVQRHIASTKHEKFLNISLSGDTAWLLGPSLAASAAILELTDIALRSGDILMFGERGIDKASVADIIHKNGRLAARRLSSIDLRSFNKDSSEGLFWSTLQELFEDRTGRHEEDDLCGTVVLYGIEGASDHFASSILEFLKKRRSASGLERMDRAVRVIVAVEDALALVRLEAGGQIDGFRKIVLPALRDRREDLPVLIPLYLEAISNRYGKHIKAISPDVLKFLSLYSWPGNYAQLETFLALSVLQSDDSLIFLKDLPISPAMFTETFLSEARARGLTSLKDVDMAFEKGMFKMVIECAGFDEDKAAGFLDIPKAAFHDRIKTLGISSKRP